MNGLIKNLVLTGSVLSLLLIVPGCCWSCKKECEAPVERREEVVVEVNDNVDAMDSAMGEQEMMKEEVK